MKKFLLILCMTAVFIYPQELKKVITQSHPSFYGFTFLDENNGWAVGLSESIYKTTNGGADWEYLYNVPGSSRTFYSVHFFNENTGYVSGGSSSSGVVLKTVNGGLSWEEVATPAATSIPRIFFKDENNAWILSSASGNARIFKTTDAGSSWTAVLEHNTGDLQDLHMLRSGHGVACGGGVGRLDIYYTADGSNWQKAPAPTLGYPSYTRTDIRGVYMVNENLVYACGWGSPVGAQPSIFLKSTDGGANWVYLNQEPENRIFQNMYTLRFKDENNGLAVGGGAYEGTIVARTTDGGVNWIPVVNGMGYTGRAIENIGDKVWVTGTGAVGYSENFGETWQMLTKIAGSTLYSLNIVDNLIIVAGYDGIIVRSTNKGYNWTSNYANVGTVCNTINGLHMINNTTGFAARNNRFGTKTTDAGLTWTSILPDTNATSMPLASAFFFDEEYGFFAGRIGNNVDAIFKTTDGGSYWDLKYNIALENLNDIKFSDRDNGVAVANDNKILYTTDGGNNWQVSNVQGVSAELDILAVTYLSASRLVAVGEKSVFISEDSGVNWNFIQIPYLDKNLTGVDFKDESEGYAVGDRFILKTVDGGNIWININDTLITEKSTFREVAVDDDGYIWIIAGSSTIFTNNPMEPISVRDNKLTPETFSLSQNYPNPFNPSTTIKYSVGRESKISLRIYDVLGNMVAELVNGNKPAGEYTVNFNAANLSSGIYFCVMKAEGKVLTSKMTLIK
jgi:photosystem II stability/assembly factor-like uncharacterized protein